MKRMQEFPWLQRMPDHQDLVTCIVCKCIVHWDKKSNIKVRPWKVPLFRKMLVGDNLGLLSDVDNCIGTRATSR